MNIVSKKYHEIGIVFALPREEEGKRLKLPFEALLEYDKNRHCDCQIQYAALNLPKSHHLIHFLDLVMTRSW